jgi:hypothetical protein
VTDIPQEPIDVSSARISAVRETDAADSRRAEPEVDFPTALIGRELQRENLDRFLGPALDRLIAESDEFITDLGIAAVRLAKGRGGTVVDDGDVAQAAKGMRYRSYLGGLLATIAVGLAGAAISLFVALVFLPEKPEGLVWWYSAAGFIFVAAIVMTTVAWRKGRG